jgi:hypothetical protein
MVGGFISSSGLLIGGGGSAVGFGVGCGGWKAGGVVGVVGGVTGSFGAAADGAGFGCIGGDTGGAGETKDPIVGGGGVAGGVSGCGAVLIGGDTGIGGFGIAGGGVPTPLFGAGVPLVGVGDGTPGWMRYIVRSSFRTGAKICALIVTEISRACSREIFASSATVLMKRFGWSSPKRTRAILSPKTCWTRGSRIPFVAMIPLKRRRRLSEPRNSRIRWGARWISAIRRSNSALPCWRGREFASPIYGQKFN